MDDGLINQHKAGCPIRSGLSCTCWQPSLTSFDRLARLEGKLDTLLNYKEPPFDERHKVLCEKLDKLDGYFKELAPHITAIEQGQGRLMARLDEGFAANGDGISFIRGELAGLQAEFSGDFAKLYNGHGVALSKIGEMIDAWNELMKLRPAIAGQAKRKKGLRKR